MVEEGVVSRTGVCSSGRLIAFMIRRRKLHGGSIYEVLVEEGLHTKVNREVQVACRVSMIHWRRVLAGFHNHEVQAPLH